MCIVDESEREIVTYRANLEPRADRRELITTLTSVMFLLLIARRRRSDISRLFLVARIRALVR